MSKKYLLMVFMWLIAIFSVDVAAQSVIPFVLTKRIVNGNVDNTIAGKWIFVTLSGNTCYDSDINGFTVNNGYLKKKNQGNDYMIFEGESYHGYCCYKIKNDYSKLNIVDVANDIIYVYKRSVPPANIVTSSWVKKNLNTEATEIHAVQLDNQIPNKRIVTRLIKCTYCNGKGSIKTFVGTSAYTDNGIIYKCLECNEIMHTYDKHIHQKCSYCIDGWRELTTLE